MAPRKTKSTPNASKPARQTRASSKANNTPLLQGLDDRGQVPDLDPAPAPAHVPAPARAPVPAPARAPAPAPAPPVTPPVPPSQEGRE